MINTKWNVRHKINTASVDPRKMAQILLSLLSMPQVTQHS